MAKEVIEQEASETLETEGDCYYECEFHSVVIRRQEMIHCSHCVKWYHATCFPMAFEYALKQLFIICRTCVIEIYHKIAHMYSRNRLYYLWIIQNCQVFSMPILISFSPIGCIV